MSVFKVGKLWHYRFVIDHKRYRGSTKQTTKYAAEEYESQLKEKIRQTGRYAISRPLLLRDFAGEFTSWLEAVTRSIKTKKYYLQGLRLLSAQPLWEKRMDQITNHDCEMAQFPGSGSNANCALRTLRRMMTKAKELGKISEVPRIHLRKENERQYIPRMAEETAIYAEVNQATRDIVLVMRGTGMRPKNVMEMQWQYVNWDELHYRNPLAKTKKGRGPKPLLEESLSVLQRLHAEQGYPKEGWVFPSPRSSTGHRTTFVKEFQRARKARGLPNEFLPYSLRHKAATVLYDVTKNLKLVMDVIGHEDAKTAMRYQHPNTRDLRRQLEDAKADGRIQ